MKKKLLIGILILSSIGIESFGAAAIGHSRWRNDDGNEKTATWKTAEDDSLIQSNESNIRLRIEIYKLNADAFSHEGFLYYASLKDTVFHLVSDDESDAFVFVNTPNITNGGITTEQLSISNASCATQSGIIRDMSGSFDFTLALNQRKEYEFSIKPSPNAEFDQSYVFVIEDNDVEVYTYAWGITTSPRIYLQKPMLTVTADDASRSVGEDNPAFSVSYSGFVDGDDESVLDYTPDVVCSAHSGSPSALYDIVPYGAVDNKYDFTYVIGHLNVESLSGINDYRNSEISIYPNPASDFIFINSDYSSKLTARIYNLTGSCVLESEVGNSQIDIRSLDKGMYILNVNGAVFKISKQ